MHTVKNVNKSLTMAKKPKHLQAHQSISRHVSNLTFVKSIKKKKKRFQRNGHSPGANSGGKTIRVDQRTATGYQLSHLHNCSESIR